MYACDSQVTLLYKHEQKDYQHVRVQETVLCGTSGGFCSESEGISVSPWLSSKNVRRVLSFFVLREMNILKGHRGGKLYEWTDGHVTSADAQFWQCLMSELEEKLT